MKAPGGLDDLGPQAAQAWDETVTGTVTGVLTGLAAKGVAPQALADDPAALPDVRAPDWPGFPGRIGACLGRRNTLELLDWRSDGQGDLGRVRHQEEYLEWRLVRDTERQITAVEMTTEFVEYWTLLAGHEPDRLREVVSGFVGRDVRDEELYGGQDPTRLDPQARQIAFSETMVPNETRLSPLNNGVEGICFMVQRNNTLQALVALVASAARPLIVEDSLTGRNRYASGSEAIAVLRAAAQDGRNSDPLVVERVTTLASSGHLLGFDDPIGVYLRGFQLSELELPDGSDVPSEWLDFSRGVGAEEAPDGRPRHQRLRLAAPDPKGPQVGDLKVRRTGEPVLFGGQLAALAQLAVYVRSGPGGDTPPGQAAPPVVVPAAGCQAAEDSLEEMQATTAQQS